MARITQRPTPPNEWLYQDQEDGTRIFSDYILIDESLPAWAECLDIEKVTWNMDFSKDIDLSDWNPTDKGTTFLQNFKEHICQRLANRTGQSKLTLTLSADVYTAIMTDDDIKAELVARNWKVTDGTNNYNN